MKSLQQQVMDNLAQDMSKSMDFEVLCILMSESGWSVLRVDYNSDSGQAWNTVMNWADENFEGEYKEHNGTWLIENAKDATMFALKWRCN